MVENGIYLGKKLNIHSKKLDKNRKILPPPPREKFNLYL
ncbi:hypothetical protein TPE_2282 [Treponema pedis str. T A4]|uniref:Uncharacterized protein n=1 Tax=Treponema pedis str. T A4 TaxID=1291379 RepID=S6A4T4_9SPIR|nr:hypothetical protein TPE_2282 [Treponema pedis str. T A4]